MRYASTPSRSVAGGSPVVVGGNSDAAFARLAAFGDGWYGFNLTAAAAAERIAALAGRCQQQGRSLSELSVAAALTDADPALVPDLARAGVAELVLVTAPPADPAEAATWLTDLASRWSLPAGAITSGRPLPVGQATRQSRRMSELGSNRGELMLRRMAAASAVRNGRDAAVSLPWSPLRALSEVCEPLRRRSAPAPPRTACRTQAPAGSHLRALEPSPRAGPRPSR